MLLVFKCSNYRSIKEKVTFSMIAGPDDTREEILIEFGKYRVLPSSVVYGPNGHGKSSLINAIAFVRKLVITSLRMQLDEPIEQFPHKLSGEGVPSEFELIFVYNNVRYAYGFSIKEHFVENEYLYYFPNNKQTKVFEREGMKIIPGDKYKNSFGSKDLKAVFQKNKLLLSCAPSNTDVDEIKEAYRFFSRDIMVFKNNRMILPFMTTPVDNAIKAASKEAMKNKVVKLLRDLGTQVTDIRSERNSIRTDELPSDISESELREKLYEIRRYPTKTQMVYDEFEVNLEKEESMGVQRLVNILPAVIVALENGKTLIFDELETSLHEGVLFNIVKLFNDPKKNNRGQLIFSTHNTNLLDAELFRRDQIWFTQLAEGRATDLYSLMEIRNVRKSENLAKGYISGKYGAMPLLNENIFSGSER